MKEIKSWARALYLAQQGKSESEKEKLIKNFLEFLKAKQKLFLIPFIFKKFKEIWKKERKVELITARAHSREIIQEIEKKFPKIFRENLEIKREVDPALIGGFRIKTKNYFICASIRDFLNKLKHELSGRI